jgi:hypothetical protein
MALNEFLFEAYLDTARSRVTEQFKFNPSDNQGARVFDNYLQLLVSPKLELQQVFKDLMQLRSLDTATGEQLNILGRIVGQDRVLINSDLYDFFGFQGALKAGSMGTLSDPTVGSVFYSLGEPLGGNVELDDSTYRLFIQAKILKNNTASTSEEFIRSMNLIFGNSAVIAIEDESGESGNVTVLFNRHLSDFERALLLYTDNSSGYPSGLIPKTIGVNVKYGEYVRIDTPISWSLVYDGTWTYDLPYTYNAIPTYSDTFDESDIEITLY